MTSRQKRMGNDRYLPRSARLKIVPLKYVNLIGTQRVLLTGAESFPSAQRKLHPKVGGAGERV